MSDLTEDYDQAAKQHLIDQIGWLESLSGSSEVSDDD